MSNTTLYKVTTVLCKGGLPHTATVAAESRAKAFIAAAAEHRKTVGADASVNVLSRGIVPVVATFPKPKLPF